MIDRSYDTCTITTCYLTFLLVLHKFEKSIKYDAVGKIRFFSVIQKYYSLRGRINNCRGFVCLNVINILRERGALPRSWMGWGRWCYSTHTYIGLIINYLAG